MRHRSEVTIILGTLLRTEGREQHLDRWLGTENVVGKNLTRCWSLKHEVVYDFFDFLNLLLIVDIGQEICSLTTPSNIWVTSQKVANVLVLWFLNQASLHQTSISSHNEGNLIEPKTSLDHGHTCSTEHDNIVIFSPSKNMPLDGISQMLHWRIPD